MNIFEFPDSQSFNEALCDDLFSRLRNGTVSSIGLSGGNTPRAFYRMLLERDIMDFDVTFYLVDERISSDAAALNREMIVEVFGNTYLDRFRFIDVSRGYDCVQSYEDVLPQGGLDLVYLGAGLDGHTAGIFSDFEVISSSRRAFVLSGTTESHEYTSRCSMSLEYLSMSSFIVLLLGEGKGDVFTQYLCNDSSDAPVCFFKDHSDFSVYTVI